ARFIRLCVTCRALELMLVAGATEEEAAWRMGFRYASGLSDHVLRTVGMRPSEIGLEHLPALASRFEAEFAPLLSSRGGHKHGQHPEPGPASEVAKPEDT